MASPRLPSARPTFLHSDRALARAAQPLVRFLHVEAAGGILLVAATVVALVWANSPWADSYAAFWHTTIEVNVGSYRFAEDLGHLVNDLLMALFFYVVGMEIKRELVVGVLRDRRAALLPACAAIGGMLVPAAIYLAINGNGPDAHGWGVPMATDIAFALGVVALLGSRIPSVLKVLLLTLAITDDLGAIVVIAVFYSRGLDPWALLGAVGVAALVAVAHRLQIVYPPVFVVLAAALWLLVYESGVHATMAGVVMGLLTPARPLQTALEAEEIVDVLEHRDDLRAADIRATAAAIRGSVSACERHIAALHPWTSYFVVPVFALANAGIALQVRSITSPSAIAVGVVAGLVVGKLVGITLFSWIAVRFGLGRLPRGVTWTHVVGMAAVAGIGFTVALFISGLAFSDAERQADAKVGVLVASVLAAALGALLLTRAQPRSRHPAG